MQREMLLVLGRVILRLEFTGARYGLPHRKHVYCPYGYICYLISGILHNNTHYYLLAGHGLIHQKLREMIDPWNSMAVLEQQEVRVNRISLPGVANVEHRRIARRIQRL